MSLRLLLVLGVMLIISSCSVSSDKLTSQGWKYFRNREYRKAEKKFSKAIAKSSRNASAYDGLSHANSALGNNNRAEYYISRAYNIYPNSAEYTYKYAALSCINRNTSKAMSLLFELPAKGDFGFYRQAVASSNAFANLKGDAVFQRYLKGYRRLLLQPYYGASTESDKFTDNDLFMLVENQGKVLLTTPPAADQNQVQWSNSYVIFDYPLGTTARISLMDEDYMSHDNLLTVKGLLIPGDFTWNGAKSTIKCRISDTERSPYTTGNQIPSTISMSQVAVGLGIGALAVASLSDLRKDTSTKKTQLDSGKMLKGAWRLICSSCAYGLNIVRHRPWNYDTTCPQCNEKTLLFSDRSWVCKCPELNLHDWSDEVCIFCGYYPDPWDGMLKTGAN